MVPVAFQMLSSLNGPLKCASPPGPNDSTCAVMMVDLALHRRLGDRAQPHLCAVGGYRPAFDEHHWPHVQLAPEYFAEIDDVGHGYPANKSHHTLKNICQQVQVK